MESRSLLQVEDFQFASDVIYIVSNELEEADIVLCFVQGLLENRSSWLGVKL